MDNINESVDYANATIANLERYGKSAVKFDPQLPARVFETGAQRDNKSGKGMFHLIPSYPLIRLARHYQNGAVKYGDRNWEKGIPLSSFLDSCERHIAQWKDGERSEDHLTAAIWNLFGLVWTENRIARGILPKELDDLSDSFIRGEELI